jgi:alpha-tubulin suppressor-like RCC1 family protein
MNERKEEDEEIFQWVPSNLAAGDNHTIIVCDTGKFYGFGQSLHGELGVLGGLQELKASQLDFPISVGRKDKVQVATGAAHTLILLRSQGKVYATGIQHALGRDTHGTVPLPEPISFVACGADFSVAIGLDRHNLYAWGIGRNGCVTDLKDRQPMPTLFHIYESPGDPLRVLQVACGTRHSIAICENRHVYAWGDGSHGKLGLGSAEDRAEPTRIDSFVVSESQRIVQVCAASSHSLALSLQGKVFAWGSGSYGRLGTGSNITQFVPLELKEISGAQSISCNTYHSLAVCSGPGNSTSLYVWGGGKHGKLGLGKPEVDHNTPQLVKLSQNAARGVCGLHHTVILTHSSAIFVWGLATSMRCGLTPPSDEAQRRFDTPHDIEFFQTEGFQSKSAVSAGKPPELSWAGSQVQCGDDFTVVLTTSQSAVGGDLLCFGNNDKGQLGAGPLLFSALPVSIFSRQKRKILSFACGRSHVIAVDTAKSVWGWGENKYGQVGVVRSDTDYLKEPSLITSLEGTGIDRVYAGESHSAAVDDKDGGETSAVVYMWGRNNCGQLGVDPQSATCIVQPQCLHIPGLPDYDKVELALGSTHSHFLLIKLQANQANDSNEDYEKTTLFSCGTGEMGQVGLEDNENAWAPRAHHPDKWNRGQGRSDPKQTSITEEKEESGFFAFLNPFNTAGEESTETKVMETTVTNKQVPDASNLMIIKIFTGAFASFAITRDRGVEDADDKIFFWGTDPALFRLPQHAPRLVPQFEPDAFRAILSSSSRSSSSFPIYMFRVKSIYCGKAASFLLLSYTLSQTDSRESCLGWGDMKCGKLGVGDIAGFQAAYLLALNNRIKSQHDEVEGPGYLDTHKMEFEDCAEKGILVPIPLERFNNLGTANDHVQSVACFSSHTVALTDKGEVFSCGLFDHGRLGFEGTLGSCQTEPRKIPQSTTIGVLRQIQKSPEVDSASDHSHYERTAPSASATSDFSPSGVEAKLESDESIDESTDAVILTDRKRVADALRTDLKSYQEALDLYGRELLECEKLREALYQHYDSRGRIIALRASKLVKQYEARQKEWLEKQTQAEDEKKIETEVKKQQRERRIAGRRRLLGDLTSTEELVCRMYLRPCFMLNIFKIYKKRAREKSSVKAQRDKMEEFCDLLLSIYDMDRSVDRDYLIRLFLILMLEDHAASIPKTDTSTLLAIGDKSNPPSMEWVVIMRLFKCTGIRRKLGDYLINMLTAAEALHPYTSTDNPAFKLHTVSEKTKEVRTRLRAKQHEFRETQVTTAAVEAQLPPQTKQLGVEAISDIRDMARRVADQIISLSFRDDLQSLLDGPCWLFQLLLMVLQNSHHDRFKVEALCRRRILGIFADVMLEDRGRQFRVMQPANVFDSKQPEPSTDKERSIHLVLCAMKSEASFAQKVKEYYANLSDARYLFPEDREDESKTADYLEKMNKIEYNIMELVLESMRAKRATLEKQRVRIEKQVLKHLLTVRSSHHRRVVFIAQKIFKFFAEEVNTLIPPQTIPLLSYIPYPKRRKRSAHG